MINSALNIKMLGKTELQNLEVLELPLITE